MVDLLLVPFVVYDCLQSKLSTAAPVGIMRRPVWPPWLQVPPLTGFVMLHTSLHSVFFMSVFFTEGAVGTLQPWREVPARTHLMWWARVKASLFFWEPHAL